MKRARILHTLLQSHTGRVRRLQDQETQTAGDHTAEPHAIGQEPGGDWSGSRLSAVPLQSHIALGLELGWKLFSPVGGGSNNKRTNTSTGTRPKRKARYTHTGQPEHTGEGARSPLCCRFTWGVWLVVVVGRQTRVWVATYVRVSTIVRYGLKYLSCLRQSSSQTHMCEILPNRYLLIKLPYLEYLS